MLQKCANPSCSAPFRSLREGKLFLAESPPLESAHLFRSSAPRLPRREHFWLCDHCAAQFTLRFDAERGMLTVPIRECAVPGFLARAAAQGA
jgi:hypothetical protein